MLSNGWKFIRRQPRWRLIVAGAVVLVLGGWGLTRGGGSAAKIPTFTARRGPLEINVMEGGSLQAQESQQVKCEVRVGYQGTKILRIVDEGYQVTGDDVKNGKILVELDSSDLQTRITQQEIQYQQAVASLIDAQQNYEIQVNQNQSDIKAAEQKARFARMDFDKYLGVTVTEKIIKQYGLDKILEATGTNNVEAESLAEEASLEKDEAEAAAAPAGPLAGTNVAAVAAAAPAASPSPAAGGAVSNAPGLQAADEAPLPAAATSATNLASSRPATLLMATNSGPPMFPVGLIDFTEYASLDALGDGEAKQKLRQLDDDLQTAEKELGQAKATLEGTERLYAKQFVAKTELVRDQLSENSSELKVQTAETDRALFLKYDFPKAAEQSLSDYTEAVRELDKARRVAISKLAQAQAKLRSAQGQYGVQNRELKELKDQLAKCTIRAEKPGLVVYGDANDSGFYFGNQEPIREGATVRERQTIITIPDMTHMAVNVKIHESYIQKIKKGQKAVVTVDAFPDQVLHGEVTKVGVLPDSQNRWMNPDLKVYDTTIAIDGTYDWIKPGMSAKAEIQVKQLDNVVYVPVQAVTPDNGRQVCYVADGFKPEKRVVEVGDYNDEFIEIKHGLRAGEPVLLRLPDGVERGDADRELPAEARPAGSKQNPAPATPANQAAAEQKV
jgi:RND family efflux transporter MFP subunit